MFIRGEFVTSADGVKLIKAFINIPDPTLRRRLVKLIRAIVEQPDS